MLRILPCLAILGCTSSPELLLEPDPSRTGAEGQPGPSAVSAQSHRVQARVTESVFVDVVYPSTADSEPLADDSPIVLLLHGGLVAPERYRWLAVHFASRGYVVALPRHEKLLAITEPGNAAVALGALRDGELLDAELAPDAAVLGHSLGGVLAARAWSNDPSIEGLGLLASYPADGDDMRARRGERPVLALAGSTDGSLSAEEMRERVTASFDEPVWFGTVDGLHHYGWTDDASPGELEGDGVPGRELSVMRQDAQRVLDTWLDAVLRDDPSALERLDEPFDGVEVP